MITVIVATHGRPVLLARLLESLGHCDLPPSYRELLVVENGSSEGAEQVVAECDSSLRARYLNYSKANKSGALNYALGNASDDLIVFFDDDVRVDSAIVKSYHVAAAACETPAYFGGPFDVDYELEPPADWVILPPSAKGWKFDPSSEKRLEFLGFNWAAYKKDLLRAGGFDERYGPGGSSQARGQETMMQEALLANGLQPQYVPEAMVWHYVPPSRCSVSWSLTRAFQNGVRSGLRYDGNAPELMGAPRWVYKKLVVSYLMSLFLRVIGKRVASYRHQIDFKTLSGIIHGSRFRGEPQEGSTRR